MAIPISCADFRTSELMQSCPKNGSYHYVKAIKKGQTIIDAALTSVVDQVCFYHNSSALLVGLKIIDLCNSDLLVT